MEERHLRVAVEHDHCNRLESILKGHSTEIDVVKQEGMKFAVAKITALSKVYSRNIDIVNKQLEYITSKFSVFENKIKAKLLSRFGPKFIAFSESNSTISSDTSCCTKSDECDRMVVECVDQIMKNRNTVSSNSDLADLILNDAKEMLTSGEVKVCLKDPASGHRMISDNSAFFS